MSKPHGNPALVITYVCPRCGEKIPSRNGSGRPPSTCPACESDLTEPVITVVGATPSRRKRGKQHLLKLVGACKTGRKNGSTRHDDYIYKK